MESQLNVVLSRGRIHWDKQLKIVERQVRPENVGSRKGKTSIGFRTSVLSRQSTLINHAELAQGQQELKSGDQFEVAGIVANEEAGLKAR